MKQKQIIRFLQKKIGFVILLISFANANAQITITNVGTIQKIGLNGNQPVAGSNVSNSNWVLEPVGAFFQIKNAATGGYLHNENGKLECGAITQGWWSAQWAIPTIENDKKYIISRFKNNQLLHMNNGVLELSITQTTGNLNAQWKVPSVASPTAAAPSGTSPFITPVTTATPQASQKVDATTGQYISFRNMDAIKVDNLIILDTVSGNNKTESFLSFDISIAGDQTTIKYLKEFEMAMKIAECRPTERQDFFSNIILTIYDAASNTDIEERTYEICMCKFTLGILDASDKTNLKAHIEVASYNPPKIGKAYNLQIVNTKSSDKALTSNFNIQLGNLDTRWISTISNVSFNSDDNKNAFAVTQFTGDKKSFADFFKKNPKEAIPTGKIVMLTPDLRKELLTIYLKNIFPQYYKSQNSTKTTGRMVTYGFKATSISFSE